MGHPSHPLPEPGKVQQPSEPTAPDSDSTKQLPNLVAMKALAKKLEMPPQPRNEINVDDLMSDRVAMNPNPEPLFEPEPPRRVGEVPRLFLWDVIR